MSRRLVRTASHSITSYRATVRPACALSLLLARLQHELARNAGPSASQAVLLPLCDGPLRLVPRVNDR